MSNPEKSMKRVEAKEIEEAVTRLLARKGFVATAVVLGQDEHGIHALVEGHEQVKAAPEVKSGQPIGIGRR